jgi:hypothetical protein
MIGTKEVKSQRNRMLVILLLGFDDLIVQMPWKNQSK